MRFAVPETTKEWQPLRALSHAVALCSTLCYTRDVGRVIAQRELRNQSAKILAAVASGASFVVTRNGTPVAELHPVTSSRRRFVRKTDLAAVAAGGPSIDAAAFRRDLDRAMDQGLAGDGGG